MEPLHELRQSASCASAGRLDPSTRVPATGEAVRNNTSPWLGPGTNDYPYRCLSRDRHEIRIIILRPATPDEDIVCDVEHISLDESPKYQALSYTWGGSPCRRIMLGGSPFSITVNLELALRRLRGRDSVRRLWIDAICINQGDNFERNDQVKQMALIYRLAQKVHIWLGPADEQSREAMKFLKTINQRVHDSSGSKHLLSKVHLWIKESYESGRDESIWEAISHLWQRAYWSRIWIIQEVVFGTSNPLQCVIHCGNDTISWETLVALENAMKIIDQFLVDNEHSDVDIIQETKGARLDLSWFIGAHGCNTRKKTLDLSYLLIRQSRYKASDPRDKVYALMSMVPDSHADGLIVDYNLPVAKVYSMAMKEIVMREKRLGVLCSCCRGCIVQPPVEKLPSWCPNFSTDPMDKCCPARLWSYTKPIYSASGDLNAEAHFKSTVLSARGWRIDKIKVFKHGLECAKKEFVSLESLLFLAEGIGGQFPQKLEEVNAAAHEDIWRTLVANRGQAQSKAPDEFGAMYRMLIADYQTSGNSRSLDEKHLDYSSESIFNDTEPFRDKMTTCLRKRLLCKSKLLGLPGLVPEKSKDGDIICIIVGCALPLILREEGDHYVLIGESYIHGFMYGKILDLEKQRKFERDWFMIQ